MAREKIRVVYKFHQYKKMEYYVVPNTLNAALRFAYYCLLFGNTEWVEIRHGNKVIFSKKVLKKIGEKLSGS